MLCGIVIENVPHLQCIAYVKIGLILEAIEKNGRNEIQNGNAI